MKFYIASKLSNRERLLQVTKELWEMGHEVTSTWIAEGGDYAHTKKNKKVAIRDLVQVGMADVFVLDTTVPLSADGGGGREFEAGFAVGHYQMKEVWRVGPIKSAFHSLVDREFQTWEELLAWVRVK